MVRYNFFFLKEVYNFFFFENNNLCFFYLKIKIKKNIKLLKIFKKTNCKINLIKF